MGALLTGEEDATNHRNELTQTYCAGLRATNYDPRVNFREEIARFNVGVFHFS